jgi:ribonuclease HIII
MEIRQKIKEKLLYFYPETFKNLEKSLNNLGELDYYLWMNSAQSIADELSEKQEYIRIKI